MCHLSGSGGRETFQLPFSRAMWHSFSQLSSLVPQLVLHLPGLSLLPLLDGRSMKEILREIGNTSL
ncbi:hypothetical protein GBAR_LOCUS13040, partial [Geodia barretti]